MDNFDEPGELAEFFYKCISSDNVVMKSLDSNNECNRNNDSLIASKQSAGISKCRSLNRSDNIYWCYACNKIYYTFCSEHQLNDIEDNSVTLRAWATLPSAILIIKQIEDDKNYGVFSKTMILPGTRFGPLEGDLLNNFSTLRSDFVYSIFTTKEMEFDLSHPGRTNWMKFVKPAIDYDDQNLCIDQHGSDLYFIVIKPINLGEELRVGYSAAYAFKRQLNLLPNDPSNCVIEHWQNGLLMECHDKKSRKGNLKNGLLQKCNDQKNEKCVKIKKKLKRSKVTKSANQTPPKKKFKKKSFNSSKRKQPPEKRNLCVFCTKNFPRKELNEHVKSHKSNNMYECIHCQKKYEKYANIKKHIRRYHCEYKFSCADCGKPFRFKEKLQYHVMTHLQLKEHLCSFCGKMLSRADKLQEHLNKVHNPESKSSVKLTKLIATNSDNNLEPTACLDFPARKIPPVPAENNKATELIKQKKFRYSYRCHVCRGSCLQKNQYIKHMALLHPGEPLQTVKAYICPYCRKDYLKYISFVNHMVVKHGRSYGDVMNSSESIIDTTSISVIAYCCQLCSLQFSKRSELIEHQNDVHPNLLPPLLMPDGTANYVIQDGFEEIEVTLDSASWGTLKQSLQGGCAEIVKVSEVEE